MAAAKAVKAGRQAEQSVWFDKYGVRFNLNNARYRACVDAEGKVIIHSMKAACSRMEAKGELLKAAKAEIATLDADTKALLVKISSLYK
jgi:hypothetical protein